MKNSLKYITPKRTDQMIKYVFNVSIVYLNHKYKHLKFIEKNNASIEDLAIDITAKFIKVNYSNGNSIIAQENKTGNYVLEYQKYKDITDLADKLINFELLKNDLITIEEFNSKQI